MTGNNVTFMDAFVAPYVNNFYAIGAVTLVWFIVQFTAKAFMNIYSAKFRALTEMQKTELASRIVSILNGITMTGSAYLFLREMSRNNWQFHHRIYDEVPGYAFFRIAIVGYFQWDTITCIYDRWGAMWTIHGLASLLGTTALLYPFCDLHAMYFTGMFELSNVPLHIAEIVKVLGVMPTVRTVCEGLFVLMYLGIRVIGGTITSLDFIRAMWELAQQGAHHPPTIYFCITINAIIMALQYIWFVKIIGMVYQVLSGGSKEKKQ